MRFIILVKATEKSEAGVLPEDALIGAMATYHEELAKAGVLLDANGLQPSAKGWRVRYEGGRRSVVEGPFAETKELVAGFWLWQVRSIEEAVEWVKRCPNPMLTDSDIEIRPIFGLEDFGDAISPECRAKDEDRRRRIEKHS